jgi:hypothetical protein
MYGKQTSKGRRQMMELKPPTANIPIIAMTAPFCDKIIQLAEDFDFDGIQRWVYEMDS